MGFDCCGFVWVDVPVGFCFCLVVWGVLVVLLLFVVLAARVFLSLAWIPGCFGL